MKIVTIVGARPQFVKAAMVSRAIVQYASEHPDEELVEEIIHTGQHYDENMSDIFFVQMGIPKPVVNLEVGSGNHGESTGKMLGAIERELIKRQPDMLMVYGDTNSTLAGALAAAKLHIPVAHVEAGLRSFNKAMPEEVNRILTDHVSEILLCPTNDAITHLEKEGITEGVHHVGDVMYDAAKTFGEIAARSSTVLLDLGLTSGAYRLATVHRAENTDDPKHLQGIFEAFGRIATEACPIILPLHPRTEGKLIQSKIASEIDGKVKVSNDHVRLVPPVSFLEMVQLESHAKMILTDSGGVQKEAYFHGKPCVTLRDETEWGETVAAGWNQIVGANTEAIVNACDQAKTGAPINEYGSGQASEEIVSKILAAIPV